MRLSELPRMINPSAGAFEPMALAELPANPLVSILITCYNYGPYLETAVKSALDQDYPRLEVVVCDDGSTDNSWEILQALSSKDKRVLAFHQSNSGQGAALNRCFAESRGEILCLLDADDWYHPGKIAAVVAAFQKHPDSGFLNHPISLVNSSGKIISQKPLHGRSPHGWQGPALVRASGMLADISPTSAIAFRRETAERLFPIPPSDFRRNGEGYLLVVVPLATSLIGLTEPWSSQRIHGENMATGQGIMASFNEASFKEFELHWLAQHDYLLRYAPALVSALPKIHDTIGYWLGCTVRQKLSGDPSWRASWRKFTAHPDFQKFLPHRRWFWRVAPTFPSPIFRYLFDLTCRPGLLKALWLKVQNARACCRSQV